jgi:hypothetical protein
LGFGFGSFSVLASILVVQLRNPFLFLFLFLFLLLFLVLIRFFVFDNFLNDSNDDLRMKRVVSEQGFHEIIIAIARQIFRNKVFFFHFLGMFSL